MALKATEVAAAQLDPADLSPTPDLNLSPAGPDWIQIGTDGGFLPKPVVVDGQQVTTWITDPTRFDVGNVDRHSLLISPAERADVIVDFSTFAGQTLILYNDAPAAFPARVPSYDYFTGVSGSVAQRPIHDPARLWPEHPDHHAGQDRRPGRPRPPSTCRSCSPPSSTRLTAPACSNPASTRSSSDRRPTTPPTAPTSRQAATAPTSRVEQARRLPPDRPVREPAAALRQPEDGLKRIPAAAGDDRAQGHPRRDERNDVRRVRADAGQPRHRGDPAHARADELQSDAGPAARRTRSSTPRTCPGTTRTTRISRSRRSRATTTGPRSGGSRTTASTPTRSTSTCTTSSCSTGSPGTTSSSRPIPTSSAGRTPSG